jgi:hypothetical protein
MAAVLRTRCGSSFTIELLYGLADLELPLEELG